MQKQLFSKLCRNIYMGARILRNTPATGRQPMKAEKQLLEFAYWQRWLNDWTFPWEMETHLGPVMA